MKYKKQLICSLCLGILSSASFVSLLPMQVAAYDYEEDHEKDGWKKQEDAWVYYLDGEKLKNGRHVIDGNEYLFDYNGFLQTGLCWDSEAGAYCFSTESGLVKNKWKKADNAWYYLDENGHAAQDWKKIDGSWYWFDYNCQMMRDGWQEINGQRYLFGPEGNVENGWKKVGRHWYHLSLDGAKSSSWLNDNGNWYYFKKSGKMAKGFIPMGNTWYYFDSAGIMSTGTRQIYGTTCTFDSSGVMTSPARPPKNPSGTLTLDEYDNQVERFMSDARFASGAEYAPDQKPLLIDLPGTAGCGAYVTDYVKYVFDKRYSFARDYENVNEIQTGDVLRFKVPLHFAAVLYRNGNHLTVAEGNVGGYTLITEGVYEFIDGELYRYGMPVEFDYGTHLLPKGVDSWQ